MGRILAVDYGSKRVGLAVSDERKTIAFPLATVESHKAVRFIEDYLQNEPVDIIVVGDALDLSGNSTDSSVLIDDFIKGLSKRFQQVKIERHDERFTSKIAVQAIRQSGISKKKRAEKGLVDKISAVVILQSYLQRLELS